MLETIFGALVPLIVTFLLGFVAAWRGDFGPKDAAILNRMVLRYAFTELFRKFVKPIF